MRKINYSMFFVAMFIMTGVAFAAQAAGAENALGGFDSWKGLVKGIAAGVIAGVSVAYLGFLKSTETDKKFDMKTAAPTFLVGAIMGAIAGFQKKDLTKPEDWYQAGTAILLTELVLKAFWRNAAPKVGEIVSSLMGKKSDEAAK
jgi:drug/metabolite transporter (DMT)-like permease